MSQDKNNDKTKTCAGTFKTASENTGGAKRCCGKGCHGKKAKSPPATPPGNGN